MTDLVTDAPLSAPERDALADFEGIIDRDRRTFVEVGNALAAIRQDKLYRERHQTFEAYCQERWDLGRSHACRLIDAASVVARLSPIGDVAEAVILPATESQARPLTTVELEDVGDVWAEVVERAEVTEDGPVITARHVQTVVDNWKAADEPYVPEGDAKTDDGEDAPDDGPVAHRMRNIDVDPDVEPADDAPPAPEPKGSIGQRKDRLWDFVSDETADLPAHELELYKDWLAELLADLEQRTREDGSG
jgi:hypothetical protein